MPNIAIVIPIYEGPPTDRLVASIPPDYRDHVLVAGSPHPIPGAHTLPTQNNSWPAGSQAALRYLQDNERLWTPDVVCTLDSRCEPSQIGRLIAPLLGGNGALVLGSRRMRKQPAGALFPLTVGRNWLTCRVIQLLTGKVYTDISPFRAMTYQAFKILAPLPLPTAQLRAPRLQMKPVEVPVDYL